MATAPSVPQAITEIYAGDEEDTVVVPPEPKVEAKPVHDPRIAEMASDMGMSDEEIKVLSPDALVSQVRFLNRKFQQAAEKDRQLDAQKAEFDRIKNPPPPQPVVERDEPFDLDPNDYDPKVFAQLKRAHEARIEGKKRDGLLNNLLEREQQREQRQLFEIVDQSFESLGTDFERAFGKGEATELDPAGPELARRKAVFQIAGGTLPKNPTPRQIQRAIQESAKQLFGQVLPPVKPAEPVSAGVYGDLSAETTIREPVTPPKGPDGRFVSKAVQQEIQKDYEWATQTAAPTHRRGQNLSAGVEKATKSVGEMMKNLDLGSSADGDSGYADKDTDFLP